MEVTPKSHAIFCLSLYQSFCIWFCHWTIDAVRVDQAKWSYWQWEVKAEICRVPGILVLLSVPKVFPILFSTMTPGLTVCSHMQEEGNSNLNRSETSLVKRRRKTLKTLPLLNEGGGYNQACPAAILVSLVWRQLMKVHQMSLGKSGWKGIGWGQEQTTFPQTLPFGNPVTNGFCSSGILELWGLCLQE